MDIESFQQQALEVPEVDSSFDPSFVPQNGEEFLMKVVYERKHCPAVIVKPPQGKHSKPTTVTVPEINEMDSVNDISPSSLRPTEQWKSVQGSDFGILMTKIDHMRKSTDMRNATVNLNIPMTDDENEWEAFCRKNSPLLSTILRINQRSLEKLLEFELEWLRDNEADMIAPDLCGEYAWLGSWIYSTLACLRMPLEPDVHSSLRDIARTCVRLRNKLGPDDVEKAAPFNLFIVIICMIYGQLDLAEYV